MDNTALREILNRIPELKHKYMGAYPADFIPQLPLNTFIIVNIDAAYMEGSHWITVANRGGDIFYGDSMGLPLERYKNIQLPYKNIHRMVFVNLQNMSLCGMYCIYFAWTLFKGFTIEKTFNDYDLLQFIYKYL